MDNTESKAQPVSTGMAQEEPLIIELSSPGHRGFDFEPIDVELVDPASALPSHLLRDTPPDLPEVSEPEVVRHYTRLSQWNYSIDSGFYPLGSCTMKYNPKMNEAAAGYEGYTRLHPAMPSDWTQGALQLMAELEAALCEISGLSACSLQPAAGAQGELAGLLCIRAFHQHRGEGDRTVMLVPDSAHGTNPASAALAGLKAVQLDAGEAGILRSETVRERAGDNLAGIMMTNPNTLGLFESHIEEITRIVPDAGGLVYMDGANMNSVLGWSRPGDWGCDVMHFNLHKTFSTPHGGGGPGAGPICVNDKLEPFLPKPSIVRDEDGTYTFDFDRPLSIGRLRTFFGQFLVMVRAYAYILSVGRDGLPSVAEGAVLNANYLRVRLRDLFDIAFDVPCMHECIFTDKGLDAFGIKAWDVAKRLIDYGFHPPTVYFPISVKGALMIEPTETETRASLDAFVDAMATIRREAEEQPDLLHDAPRRAFRARLDETKAARNPVLTWGMIPKT